MKEGVNRHESAIGLGVLSWSLTSSRSPKCRCGGIWASVRASLRLVDLCAAAGPAEVVPGPTSGKLFLKAAYSSSSGFWDVRRLRNICVGCLSQAGGGGRCSQINDLSRSTIRPKFDANIGQWMWEEIALVEESRQYSMAAFTVVAASCQEIVVSIMWPWAAAQIRDSVEARSKGEMTRKGQRIVAQLGANNRKA